MEAAPAKVSVIVLNWQRPDLLPLTLYGLKHQDFGPFELVVVSDRPRPSEFSHGKWVQVSEANVSGSRNAGLAVAGGDWLAFLDDDAVPERDWLSRLMAQAGKNVGAIGGPTLGPNGWRVQWGRVDLDRTGLDVPAGEGVCPKLSGTNLALSRSALERVGGFNPVFRYFHDDTDIVLRMADAGFGIAWTEDAIIHHGYAPSIRRRRFGVPKVISDVARSQAAFLRLHAPTVDPGPILAFVRQRERRRLLRQHRLGLLRGSEIWARLAEFDAALGDHGEVPPSPLPLAKRSAFDAAFVPEPKAIRVAVAPTLLARRKAKRDAEALLRQGCEVTRIEFRYSIRRLRVRLLQGAEWLHLGGTFKVMPVSGRRPFRLRNALVDELARIHPHRQFTHVLGYSALGNRRWWAASPSQDWDGFFQRSKIHSPINLR